jgi:crotonobetainyl-CoA:carnitine CoA-transferase CaiB-like acyl-CoA transferase
LTGPLEGIRVLDLGTRLAAPFCAGQLGEMGAEVIKIEQPDGGDMMRTIGPFVADGDGDDATEYSLYWSVEGRGRKSVTLDLRRPEGQAILRTLAASSDVLVENFRPGTLERWNIGPDDLDPKLVIVRISVFGQDGPYRERPGLDRLGIAYGGLLNLTGYPDEPPVRPGLSISDYLTGLFAAQAATAALYERDARGGRGQVVDAPLYGSILRINEWTLAAYDQLGTIRSRNGNRMENSAPINNYSTADGEVICIVAGADANFRRLCAVMYRPDVPSARPFAPNALRAEHADGIDTEVAEWARSLPAADIERRCSEAGVPVAPILDAAGIFADPHIAAREDLITVDDPVLGPVRQQAPFPRFGNRPHIAPSGAPCLGEHTRSVLRELCGLTADELDGLAASGII